MLPRRLGREAEGRRICSPSSCFDRFRAWRDGLHLVQPEVTWYGRNCHHEVVVHGLFKGGVEQCDKPTGVQMPKLVHVGLSLLLARFYVE